MLGDSLGTRRLVLARVELIGQVRELQVQTG